MKIGECVGRSTLKGLRLFNFSPSFQSEEAVKEWVQSVVVGGNSLIRSLEYPSTCRQCYPEWINSHEKGGAFSLTRIT